MIDASDGRHVVTDYNAEAGELLSAFAFTLPETMIWWLTLACLPNPESVSLSGQVLSSPSTQSRARPVCA